MVQQVVNVGTQANDATGDLLRDAFTKINTNFAALFAGNFPAAQLTVGPPVSGNALTAIGISGSAAIVATAFSVTDISLTATGTASFAGGVTFGTPTGGNKGAGSFNASSGFINNVAIPTGTIVNSITTNTGLSSNVAATGAVTVTNTGVLSITGTANQIAASASTGAVTLTLPQNVVVPASASGIGITASGGTSTDAAQFNVNHSAGTGISFNDTNGSPQSFRLGLGIGDASASFIIWDSTNSAIRFKITSTGGIIIPAPSSGDNLLLTNVAGGNALTLAGNSAGTAVLRLNTQATTGAQTATFAASNKPGSGTTGPDKWIPINLDGTTHYVPAFL